METIAELGYAQATFARIAERAGLSSTRLISYHFAGKSELIAALVDEAYADITRHMTEHTRAATGPREALHAYIRALVGYIAEHPKRMRTLTSVFLDHRAEDGGRSCPPSPPNPPGSSSPRGTPGSATRLLGLALLARRSRRPGTGPDGATA
ncbi:TetR/AcrR family transcriptional regulator [Streptomyces sp. NPDC057900]|uniref:TetR/AcrR family transcriptional regulator n=1 Tax=Streptomyces sp. NPDC057900 TaxID=3346274 RepID=UPI0036E4773F